MGLAPHIGRQQAHDVVYDACKVAIEENKSLFDVLVGVKEISSAISQEELKKLCDPVNYLGSAQRQVDSTLAVSGR